MHLVPDYHTVSGLQRQHRARASERRLATALRSGLRARSSMSGGRSTGGHRRPGVPTGTYRPALAE